jgi:hypothetical protein
MKRWLLVGLFSVLAVLSGLPEEKEAPAATLTEVEGKAEMMKGQDWVELLPLQPLYPGDIIRIGEGGKAVLSYLGFSAETITEANSPYTIREPKIGASRGKKAISKLVSIFRGLIRKSEERSVALVTRAKGGINVIQPDNTPVLYPEGAIIFQWEDDRPPYSLHIYQKVDGQGRKAVYEKQVEESLASVPAEIFLEGTTYNWVNFSDSKQGGGAFQILSKAETRSLRGELSELLQEIPEGNRITRYLVEYGFLTEKGLFYDAYRALHKARAEFPENETFPKLLRLFGGPPKQD